MNSKLEGHRYGGDWSETKLAIVSAYVGIYSQILNGGQGKGYNFETWYFDAFAGTGDRVGTVMEGGIHEGVPVAEVERRYDGSARLALLVEPPFQHYRLIENQPQNFEVLKRIVSDFPGRDIECIPRDANTVVREIFSSPPWSSTRSHLHRALVFLDPFGMEVEWETLQVLAASRFADVWYFFNLEGVVRQCALSADKLDQSKIDSLSAMFGTGEWRQAFYRQPLQASLLDAVSSDERAVSKRVIGEWATERFRTLFEYVSDPIEIDVRKRGQPFSLYCMSNNPSHAAQNAIKRAVTAVRKLRVPASRRRSGP